MPLWLQRPNTEIWLLPRSAITSSFFVSQFITGTQETRGAGLPLNSHSRFSVKKPFPMDRWVTDTQQWCDWCHFSLSATLGSCPWRSSGLHRDCSCLCKAQLLVYLTISVKQQHIEACFESELDQPHLPTLPCQLALAWRSPAIGQRG